MPVNTIMGLFAKSPIKPLQQHIHVVNECCQHLLPFLEAAHQNNWVDAEAQWQILSQKEKDADALKRQIRLTLPRGLFMPIDRSDILELLTQQDKLANIAKDIAGRILGREMAIPDEIYQDFIAYVKRSLDAAQQAQRVIYELDELLEAGFKGREVELVEKMIQQLDEIEDATDAQQIQLRRQLRRIEQDHSPIDMMFLYKVLEWTGGIADQAQRVGARLEIMLSRA